jgi:hypothetical protein
VLRPGCAENARLRGAVERQRVLLADKDATIAELAERVARPERLISRNRGKSLDAAQHR